MNTFTKFHAIYKSNAIVKKMLFPNNQTQLVRLKVIVYVSRFDDTDLPYHFHLSFFMFVVLTLEESRKFDQFFNILNENVTG